jgi:4-hydroxy-4-methyl-2-oxoglutarate aldolase
MQVFAETGVVSIPPHLAEEVATSAADIRLRDAFSKQRLAEGRCSALLIDRDWAEEIEQDFRRWRAERR